MDNAVRHFYKQHIQKLHEYIRPLLVFVGGELSFLSLDALQANLRMQSAHEWSSRSLPARCHFRNEGAFPNAVF